MPKIPPINSEPTASGIGEPVRFDIAMQPPATITLSTAAESSNRTTFTHGSSPRITENETVEYFCKYEMKI